MDGDRRPEVSIIIPCLNEEQNVPSVVDKLVRLMEETGNDAEILIVDDCSDDYTFREAFLLSNDTRPSTHCTRGCRAGSDMRCGSESTTRLGGSV